MAELPLSSVEDEFVDPFDRLALKGQSVRPLVSRQHVASQLPLVELADEFELTTADALEICEQAGIVAEHGGSMVRRSDADTFRSLARAARSATVD